MIKQLAFDQTLHACTLRNWGKSGLGPREENVEILGARTSLPIHVLDGATLATDVLLTIDVFRMTYFA